MGFGHDGWGEHHFARSEQTSSDLASLPAEVSLAVASHSAALAALRGGEGEKALRKVALSKKARVLSSSTYAAGSSKLAPLDSSSNHQARRGTQNRPLVRKPPRSSGNLLLDHAFSTKLPRASSPVTPGQPKQSGSEALPWSFHGATCLARRCPSRRPPLQCNQTCTLAPGYYGFFLVFFHSPASYINKPCGRLLTARLRCFYRGIRRLSCDLVPSGRGDRAG